MREALNLWPTNWQHKHHRALKTNYQKAKYFRDYEYLLEEIYLTKNWEKISDLNIFSTRLIAKALGIEVEWHRSSELMQSGSKEGEKAIKICQLLGCDAFLNGPAAKEFMDESLFRQSGVKLEYMAYSYPEYPQLHGDFVPYLSALDLVLNCGEDGGALLEHAYTPTL